MAGCSSQKALLPGPAGSIPSEVVMEGLEGSLPLRVGSNIAWRIESQSSWLTATPQSGLGPRVVQLRAHFSGQTPNQPDYLGSLSVTGDLQTTITVRLPLTRVVGSITDGLSASVAGGVTPLLHSPTVQTFAANLPGSSGLRQYVSQARAEILVKYRTDLRNTHLPQGSRVLSHDRVSRITRLESSNPQALLDRLRLDPSVEWAEINGTVSAQGEPTDEHYLLQWYLRSTGARFTYLQRTYSTPITVAVVDTGVRYDHPDLAGRLWLPGEGAWDFVGDSANPADPCGDPDPRTPGDNDPTDPCDLLSPSSGSHGTHVTGIIAANSGTFIPACPTCTDSGIVGMAHNASIKVLPLRVLDSRGSGTFEDVALAIRYAAGIPVGKAGQLLENPRPARVINLSLGGGFSHAMCEAVADVVARGVLVVAAAGNFQEQSPGAMVYPAACPGAISVAATTQNHQVAFYSQQNSEVDIAAPGGDAAAGGILSTTWNFTANQPNYTFYMGTSQATPQVAAALAMLLSSGKPADAAQAWNLLRSSLTDLGPPGRDDAYGHGLLNLPGAFGWTLPRGGFLADFGGPSPRRVPAPDGRFEAFLVPGRYLVRACRDDSGNHLCDMGEPIDEREVQVSGGNSLDLGMILVGP